MEKVIFVYDNIEKPNKQIQKIIGNKKYADILLKKKTVYSKLLEIIENEKVIGKIIKLDSVEQIQGLIQQVKNSEFKIIHYYSRNVVTNEEEFKYILQKSIYIPNNMTVVNKEEISMLMFKNILDYIRFLENIEEKNVEKLNIEAYDRIETEAILNIGEYNNFLKYISGGFDARYFNSLKTDENIVIKSSQDKEKMKKEYMYYVLLPENMKKWMVAPYNYQEKQDSASYEMERLYIPDIAIRWVHEAITEQEFKNILNKTFYYLNSRAKKQISKEEYINIANNLYIEKLDKRIEQLKKCEKYHIIASYIKEGTSYNNIDEIVDDYKKLYYEAIKEEKEYISVIGHGDLCFSNMLYEDDIELLKLIDPKGAVTEQELWTNPNYDIAKLSHSICGKYDFFNSGAYEIELDSNLKFKISIKFDNENYVKIFKNYLEKNGINYKNIRIYETSLFLSMLPLHMDYPKKVFGFILNAINIMNELKKKI